MLLVDTKNGTNRTAPLSTAAIAILKSLPRRLDGNVFGMTEMQITKTMRRVTKSAGIEGMTFHDLRHEGTSRLFERTKLPEKKIAQITGHKTAQMLWRYSHLRADDLVAEIG
jgi:integrase